MPWAEFEIAVIALRITRRPGATEPDATALALPPEGLTIGRSVDCGLALDDPLRMVSRQHAQVIAVGQAARVRCISSSAPLWVNGMQLDPGGEHALLVGDRLRIGGFELAVEPAAATSAQRSRLDRWFDLDEAPDPLAAESPLPAVAPSSESAATSAVVSWQTSRHVVRTVTSLKPMAPSMPPAPSPLQAPAPEATPRSPPAAAGGATSPVPAAASAAAAPAVVSAAARGAPAADGMSPDLLELAAAFGRGAGLGAEVAPLTPAWMEHLGALLRATAEGTLALLQSRAVAKRHMRAEGTHIAPRQNNPLKFSPDATEALTRMLQRDASPGFLDPVAALHDAHHDLLVHQVAMVAGMRAAVFELFSRLGPEAAENGEGPAHGVSRLPLIRAAALWQRHRMQHAQLLEHLDDDFQTIFGREFLRAYEAQSRLGEDASPDATEAP
ncbi:type VI secretion system-associated FHA domain protein TagH [Variovorax sp. J22R24]|uniref:type VI secretion system-associated FHA domain protein TagH n=1 Tax=Variovorax gracilis TaxID=3053502 RepID=UPI002578FE8F|nr:type VI secretion system-associated FHA domain protein TagH [Variovorax sp. J22R24]MDM0108086.1 type VI secretion system-associated FHA domain protein TagH [Variovorax sp. J22R24]